MHIWTVYTTCVPHDKINRAKSFLYESTFVTENTCQVMVPNFFFFSRGGKKMTSKTAEKLQQESLQDRHRAWWGKRDGGRRPPQPRTVVRSSVRPLAPGRGKYFPRLTRHYASLHLTFTYSFVNGVGAIRVNAFLWRTVIVNDQNVGGRLERRSLDVLGAERCEQTRRLVKTRHVWPNILCVLLALAGTRVRTRAPYGEETPPITRSTQGPKLSPTSTRKRELNNFIENINYTQ